MTNQKKSKKPLDELSREELLERYSQLAEKYAAVKEVDEESREADKKLEKPPKQYSKMGVLESELTQDEGDKAEEFCSRLKEPDLGHVKRIIKSVDGIARSYFSSGEQHSNCLVFCDGVIIKRNVQIEKLGSMEVHTGSPEIKGIDQIGTPFFAVYLVGGYLNKVGERQDIDLLVATNMRWTKGFMDWGRNPEDYDPMWAALFKEFGDGFSITREGELPDDYNIGSTQGKVLIRIHPKQGKRIDLCYVRSWDKIGYKFISEEQFIKKDVGTDGYPLSRLPLYRATSGLEIKPKMDDFVIV